jgi:hypothetical protein
MWQLNFLEGRSCQDVVACLFMQPTNGCIWQSATEEMRCVPNMLLSSIPGSLCKIPQRAACTPPCHSHASAALGMQWYARS